jgi:chromosome segregation ATPase
MARSTESIDDLSLADLRQAVAALAAQLSRLQGDVAEFPKVVAELKLEIAARDAKIVEQAEEIARLKGLPPRPKFKGKPSGMEQATSPLGGKRNGRKGVVSRNGLPNPWRSGT